MSVWPIFRTILGSSFYHRAATQARASKKVRLLDAIAREFEPWRQRQAQLGRDLSDLPYLLAPPAPPT